MSPDEPSNPAKDIPAEGAPQADRRMLEMLACPITKGPLIYDETAQELISRAARVAYPIREGSPHMVAEEARPLTDEELRALGKS